MRFRGQGAMRFGPWSSDLRCMDPSSLAVGSCIETCRQWNHIFFPVETGFEESSQICQQYGVNEMRARLHPRVHLAIHPASPDAHARTACRDANRFVGCGLALLFLLFSLRGMVFARSFFSFPFALSVSSGAYSTCRCMTDFMWADGYIYIYIYIYNHLFMCLFTYIHAHTIQVTMPTSPRKVCGQGNGAGGERVQ